MISKADSKIWITTGYGLEEYLTDATTKTIIENIILPEFRKANYYEGIDKVANTIFEVLDGNFEALKFRNHPKISHGLLLYYLFYCHSYHCKEKKKRWGARKRK